MKKLFTENLRPGHKAEIAFALIQLNHLHIGKRRELIEKIGRTESADGALLAEIWLLCFNGKDKELTSFVNKFLDANFTEWLIREDEKMLAAKYVAQYIAENVAGDRITIPFPTRH